MELGKNVSKQGAGDETKHKMPHKLELDAHKLLSVTGVKNVPTFTEKGLSAELDGETLLIGGKDLSVKQLDVESGKLVVTGFVTSLRYTVGASPSGIVKKIFK